MNPIIVGGIITGSAMVLVAFITGFWAWRNKRTPEPTPIEKLWDRLDKLESKTTTQQATIESQADRIEGQGLEVRALKQEVKKLLDQVVAYRGAFLAHVSWAGRVQDSWTGSVPIVAFTKDEETAIARGMEMSDLERLGDEQTPGQ